MNTRKALGFFQVVMINVIAVDSIRNLPFSAAYGFSLIFFYLLVAATFFIPAALVTAEMGSSWPTKGGMYIWVREAFGKKMSLLSLWINWTYNLFWYPTMMALIAGTLAYFFKPELVESKLYMATTVVALFWLVTLLNCFGLRISSFFSSLAAVVGTLIPICFIVIFGIWWFTRAEPLAIDISAKSFLPSAFDLSNAAYLTNVLFGLIGLEMSATHADEMRDPKHNYARSLFASAVIILASTILASLAIALVVPHNELSLVVGFMQAFATFTQALNLNWLMPLITACIVLGTIGCASAWVLGPTKGLMVTAQGSPLPAFLTRENRHGAPVNVLILQAVIVTFLSMAFVLMPTVSSSFWLLSVITAQLALFVYTFLFASALKLRKSQPAVHRPFKVPGGKLGIWIVSTLGIFTCLLVIALGFIPPAHTPIENHLLYELALIGGMLLFAVLPFTLLVFKKRTAK